MSAQTVNYETGEIAPDKGEIHDGKVWTGHQWEPIPRLGTTRNGWIWNGTRWEKHRDELPAPLEVQAKFDLLEDLIKVQQHEVTQSRLKAARARSDAEKARAKAHLVAEGPEHIRKKTAELETVDLFLAAEVADILARDVEAEMWRMKDMQENNRSTNAMVNSEMSMAGRNKGEQ